MDLVDYAFMGADPNAADNRWLREAMESQVAIIYFLGTAPGMYQPLTAYIAGWDGSALKAKIAFAATDSQAEGYPAHPAERRYALRKVKQRLHQASCRESVIAAYGGKCAISGLTETRLLDAAHIVPDSHEELGHPVITKGLPLSKLHHAAFDAHLLGIDPDFQIHVSQRLLSHKDGPMHLALIVVPHFRTKTREDGANGEQILSWNRNLASPPSYCFSSVAFSIYSKYIPEECADENRQAI